jgi:hypothetical protein
MAFVNGAQMTQVLSLVQMVQGTFFVDETQGQIYLWPPSGVDPNSADVEVADRYQLWVITTKNGVVLRGLTFEYSADCVDYGAVELNFGASSNYIYLIPTPSSGITLGHPHLYHKSPGSADQLHHSERRRQS